MSHKLSDREKNRFRDKHDTEAMPREQFKRAENPQTVTDEALVAVLLRTGTRASRRTRGSLLYAFFRDYMNLA